MSKVEVRQIGTVLAIDNDGFLIREVSKDKIDSSWNSFIEEYITQVKNLFGDSLHSIYVRGSVARGAAMTDAFVDFDAIVIQKSGSTLPEEDQIKGLRKNLEQKYPNLVHIEVADYVIDDLGRARALVALQGVCVYGEDIIPTLSRIKPGEDSFIHLPAFSGDFENFKKRLANEKRLPEYINSDSIWFGKRILRVAHELVAGRLGRFTRDLYPCYEGFSQIYPEKREEMLRVLTQTLNPTSDRTILLDTYGSIASWMTEEIDRLNKK